MFFPQPTVFSTEFQQYFMLADFEVAEVFMEDRQLAYGIDWSPEALTEPHTPGIPRQEHPLVACSFYDHVLDEYIFSEKESE